MEKTTTTKLIEKICIDHFNQYNSIFEIENKSYGTDISSFFIYVINTMIDEEDLNIRDEFFLLGSIDLMESGNPKNVITRTLFMKIGFLKEANEHLSKIISNTMVELVDHYSDYQVAINEFNNFMKDFVTGYKLGYKVEFDILNFNSNFTDESVKQKTIT